MVGDLAGRTQGIEFQRLKAVCSLATYGIAEAMSWCKSGRDSQRRLSLHGSMLSGGDVVVGFVKQSGERVQEYGRPEHCDGEE